MADHNLHIHITGAAGSGTSTLGRLLAESLGVPWFDTDDFYWLPTAPPYESKRPIPARLALLDRALTGPGWVLSGSLVGWGDPLVPLFDAVVFVITPRDERLRRLRERETARYGADAVAPGGSRHRPFTEFMEWAAAYESGPHDIRSRAMHEAWIAGLPCPVVRVEGLETARERAATVTRALQDLAAAAG